MFKKSRKATAAAKTRQLLNPFVAEEFGCSIKSIMSTMIDLYLYWYFDQLVKQVELNWTRGICAQTDRKKAGAECGTKKKT